MNKHLALMIVLAPVSLLAEEAKMEDNLDAQIVLRVYENDLAAAKKVYDLAAARAAAKAVKELEVVQKYEQKSGRLEVAVAVKTKIEELNAVIAAANIVPAKKQKPIVGKWTWFTGRVAFFRANGTASQYDGTRKFCDGTWLETQDGIEVTWDQGKDGLFHDLVSPDGDAWNAVSKTNGLRCSMKKLKE
jgi:hypothetical protein